MWEAADILPFSAFVERLYEDALYSELAPRMPVLLSAPQEQVLWERVIERAGEGHSALLSVPRAAELARDAWSLAHEWQLADRLRSYPGGEDARTFAAWAQAYERITARESSTDRARLPSLVAPHLSHPSLRKPAKLVAYGFDILAPQQRAFFDALAQNAVEVLESAPVARASDAKRIAFTAAKDEAAAAARWARARLEAGAPRIGIVVPDLQRSRASILRELEKAMGSRAPFNVSLGEPLSSYPIVAAAFMLLDLAGGEVPFATASRVLRSPFIAGAESELALRSKLDSELRRSAGAQLGLEPLRKLIARSSEPARGPYAAAACPKLEQCLAKMAAQAKALSGSRDAREWGRAISDLLDAAGYPGERTLDSTEYQALKKLHDLVASFASLERVVGSMGFAAARARLARMAADTVFQPEAADVPVQVLGVLESAGLEFEHLWVMGLTDESWPLAARPNPFVPVALQREAGVPQASASASLELDRRITGGWLGAAGEVVLSHALREEDRELVASPLIRDVTEGSFDELGVPAYDTFVDALRSARREELVDDRAPALASAVSGGGTSLFTDQAACPFRAFARHRLGVREMEEPGPGLDARDRGTVVHEMLARLWTKLKSHALLEAASQSDLDALVADAVDTALARVRRYRPDALKGRLGQVERERLTGLAHEWLALERKRPSFEVVAIEEKHAVTFGGVSVNAKLDRMDRVSSPGGARHVVIDYKTGQVNISGWIGPRLDEPQLPLYTVGRGGPHAVDGAAFARVRPGAKEMRFVGIAREEGLIPGVASVEKGARELRDWDHALGTWRQELDLLGREFIEGVALVDPKEGDETCRFCDLKAVCRINERSSPLSDDEGGAEGS